MPVDVLAEVLANTRLSSDCQILALAAPEIAAQTRPGQFVMVKAASGTDPLLRRPFSVFEILRDRTGTVIGLSLLSRRVGVTTGQLFDMEPGARVACLGPLGRAFTLADPPAEAWMVAGGVGLAPFATLAETLAARGVPLTLFLGGRRAADLFCLDLFERLGARLSLATEDGSVGHHGIVTEPLTRALAARPASQPVSIYACGPEPMLAAVGRIAAEHGRPAELAMERIMGCGVGGCYSCVVRVRDAIGRTRFVRSCLEGPVFKGEDIVWD
jgi:dihydroorotate dehydrogenase electron transfer subunit